MKSTPGLRRNPECTPARSGTRARAARAGLILAVALGGVACAVNPATGRRQTMLISEEGEFRVGKQADEQIRKEYGVYLEKPELRNYVVSIGRQLAARGARPNLEYHFEVLDSTLVGRWVHLAAILRNGALASSELFIDGQPRTATCLFGVCTAPRTVAAPFDLGASDSYEWHGMFDETRVHRRALSPAEIATLYTDACAR